MSELDLELIASFLALADEAHYVGAAARLHITISALNKRIRRLEADLGVILLDRDCHASVRLTPDGKVLAISARPMLAEARAIKTVMKEASSKYVVRLGVPGPLGVCPRTEVLQLIVTALRATNPEFRLRVIGLPLHSTQASLVDGTVDLLWTVEGHRVHAIEYFRIAPGVRSLFVPYSHKLYDAVNVDAETACSFPILRNADLPNEWMDPFSLIDVSQGTRRNLVDTSASEPMSLAEEVLHRNAAVVGPPGNGDRPDARLRELPIIGAPPIWYVACRRRGDRRPSINATMRCVISAARACVSKGLLDVSSDIDKT